MIVYICLYKCDRRNWIFSCIDHALLPIRPPLLCDCLAQPAIVMPSVPWAQTVPQMAHANVVRTTLVEHVQRADQISLALAALQVSQSVDYAIYLTPKDNDRKSLVTNCLLFYVNYHNL